MYICMMSENEFWFKKFKVAHGKSTMKVGVDAVILGAWAGETATKILDIGTGCGVIALILAQRFPEACIIGIDIDEESVKEANENFKDSPWDERLNALKIQFPEALPDEYSKFDLVVSNPPYFKSGIDNPMTRREKARHQDTLSVFSLIEHAGKFLTEDGVLSMIFPIEFKEEVLTQGLKHGWHIHRKCYLRDNPRRNEKRVMMEFKKGKEGEISEERITLFESGKPSERYTELCREFYLKF